MVGRRDQETNWLLNRIGNRLSFGPPYGLGSRASNTTTPSLVAIIPLFKSMLRSITGLVVVLLCCASAYSQQTQRGQISGIREIIPGHYMFSSGGYHNTTRRPQV
jgi:hypothetical protein